MSSARRSIRLLVVAILFTALTLPAMAQGASEGRFLQFNPAVVELGDVPSSADSVSVDFSFTNISPSSVSIVETVSQCSCTRAFFSGKAVPSGKDSSLKVTLYLENLTGPQKRHLTVISTDGKKLRLSTITVICNVIR